LIEAVIFDLDGTLIHLPVDYVKLFKEFREIMHVDNVQPVTEVVSKLDKKTRQQIFKVWDKAELAAAPNIKINKEGMEIYKRFSMKAKAMVTMQGEAVVKKILPHLMLSFDSTVTREDSLNRTQQLENAAEKLKIQLVTILFVGNTENDALAAEKVGCQFLMVK
jgi:HAD superfamily hydrolase (TIGR01549 family)